MYFAELMYMIKMGTILPWDVRHSRTFNEVNIITGIADGVMVPHDDYPVIFLEVPAPSGHRVIEFPALGSGGQVWYDYKNRGHKALTHSHEQSTVLPWLMESEQG